MIKITDAHTHIFPDALARKAVASTGDYYKLPMFGQGTLNDLLQRNKAFDVGACLVCSTATKPSQVCSVNDFIADCCKKDPSLVGFGTLHPDMDNLEIEISRIVKLGLRGVKLHSDFQGFTIDGGRAMAIYEILEGKLPILFHMGDQNTTQSKPKSLAAVCRRFPRLMVIAAHLGGYSDWDNALNCLSDFGIYFDTSSSLAFLSPKRAREQIRAFGASRCLFGTDYPMWNIGEELAFLEKLSLTEDERALILYKNFEELFG